MLPYPDRLRALQIHLSAFQRDVIAHGRRLLLIVEGRDAAGKDGFIKALTEHLSPRESRVVALPKPSERERTQWYFQRFIAHLPAAGEIVIFNRSWYNRAGVEPVMGFCTEAQTEAFFPQVLDLERDLVADGLELRKVYLDIDRQTQAERLAERRADPLKSWKISPIDARALELFDAYTVARDRMFEATHHAAVPWLIANAVQRKRSRLSLIAALIKSFKFDGKPPRLPSVDRSLVYPWRADLKAKGMLHG